MNTNEMVPAREFCVHHNIELSFIHSLRQYGMIQTLVIKEEIFLPLDQIQQLEKMVRWHYELDINLEGIQTITHLLQQITAMQRQIVSLTNRLKPLEQS